MSQAKVLKVCLSPIDVFRVFCFASKSENYLSCLLQAKAEELALVEELSKEATQFLPHFFVLHLLFLCLVIHFLLAERTTGGLGGKSAGRGKGSARFSSKFALPRDTVPLQNLFNRVKGVDSGLPSRDQSIEKGGEIQEEDTDRAEEENEESGQPVSTLQL